MPSSRHDFPAGRVAQALSIGVARASYAVSMFDTDMRYVSASRQWRRDYGLPEGAIAGRSIYEFMPEIPDRWREFHRRGIAGESFRSDFDLFARPNGEVMKVKWTLDPWHAADGTVGGIVIVTEELARKADLPSLDEQVAHALGELYERHVTGIVVVEPDGTVLRANERYLALVARGFNEVVGSAFAERIHVEDRGSLAAAIEDARAGHARSGAGRHRVQREDGSIVWLEHSIVHLRSAPGAPPRVLVAMVDATARVELEQRLRETERLASLGTLFSSIGHDLGNVLLPLRANFNAIEALVPRSPDQPTLLKSLSSARTGLGYIQHLVDGVGYLGGDGGEPDGEPTDIAAWWHAVEPLLRAMFPSRIALTVRIDADTPAVAMSRHELTRLMLNLVSNARDAVEARGADDRMQGLVSIEAACSPPSRRGGVRLCVRDNGIGMSEAVRLRAGEPFFTTKPRGRGTGLGVMSVRRAVEDAGGALEIESEQGVGTEFRIDIPAARLLGA
ncbi:MAG: hypothetical protein RL325_326 [Planctomycetota bacterium]